MKLRKKVPLLWSNLKSQSDFKDPFWLQTIFFYSHWQCSKKFMKSLNIVKYLSGTVNIQTLCAFCYRLQKFHLLLSSKHMININRKYSKFSSGISILFNSQPKDHMKCSYCIQYIMKSNIVKQTYNVYSYGYRIVNSRIPINFE